MTTAFEPSGLDDAYQRTTYWVELPQCYAGIHVHEVCSELDTYLIEAGYRTWAFLTACNPRSVLLSPGENLELMSRLRSELESSGQPFLHGLGAGWSGDWPPEPSVLVLNLSVDTATTLAAKYSQLAFVFGELHQRSRLIWTDVLR